MHSLSWWQCYKKMKSSLLIFTWAKITVESTSHVIWYKSKQLCQELFQPVASMGLSALHAGWCSKDVFSNSQLHSSSFLFSYNRTVRKKQNDPPIQRPADGYIFLWLCLWLFQKRSQAFCTNAFTSEYFATSKGNFYELEFMKNKLQVEGRDVSVK